MKIAYLCPVMKRIILLFLSALLAGLSAGAQAPFAKYLDQAGDAPFIVIDKQGFKLTLADAQACCFNFGRKNRINIIYINI